MSKDNNAKLNELICSDCGQYESECKCDKLFHNYPVFTPPPVVGDLIKDIRDIVSQKGACKRCDSFCDTYGICYNKETNGCPKADSILNIIKEAGYVKLAEDQDKPAFARVDIEGRPEVGSWYDGYLAGQNDLIEAGWRKIE